MSVLTDEEKKAIEIVKSWENTFRKEEYLDLISHNEIDADAMKTVLNLIKQLTITNKELDKECSRLEKKEVELEKEIEEYEILLDVLDNREYRKKYLEERRKEQPDLLYPDSDEIYKQYYEQKKIINEMKKFILENGIMCEFLEKWGNNG